MEPPKLIKGNVQFKPNLVAVKENTKVVSPSEAEKTKDTFIDHALEAAKKVASINPLESGVLRKGKLYQFVKELLK